MRSIILLLIFICFFHANYATAACDADLTPSTDHLSVYTDGNIYDNKTGLIWKKCLEGLSGSACEGTASTFTWSEALAVVENDTTWRLPNIKELQSIVEEGCAFPAINTIFPGTHTTGVWSNSPISNEQSFYIDFSKYGNIRSGSGTDSYHVRLVRDAPTE